jgi:hypothetical protein
MKKTRIQPSLAGLTPEEKNQLADWLRKADYLDVLERVRKPRTEGGFGLTISKKPLQTFYGKVMLLDAINARLPDDKKMTITDFESIANADRLLAMPVQDDKCKMLNVHLDSRSEQPNLGTKLEAGLGTPCSMEGASNPVTTVSSETHSAIMSATYDLATSGDNTPTSLLALQRLADFPARAEYRAHKDAMYTHRKEMDAQRKHLANQRLNLAKKSFEFRQRLALPKTQVKPSPDTVANTPKSSENTDKHT